MKKNSATKTVGTADSTVVTPILRKQETSSKAYTASQETRKLIAHMKKEGKLSPRFFEWLGTR